jgi:hypothetical protein
MIAREPFLKKPVPSDVIIEYKNRNRIAVDG